MKTGRKLAFSLAVLVGFLGLAEAGLRLAGWPGSGSGSSFERSAFEHNDVYWIEDPDLDREPVPHREMGSVFHVSTDHQGLRYPLHSLQKPPGVFRVMAMGCSTTFGWGVDDAESWPARLEALAREAGYSNVEVINAGQPGYTTFQGRWLWDHVAGAYHPDLVLLGYIVQDARKAAWSDLSQAVLMRNAAFLKQNVLYRWRLYLGLKAMLGQLRIRARERGEDGSGGVYRVSERQYLQNLRYLRGRIQEDGGQVVHFGFPLERVGYTEHHRRLLRLEAEAAGIPWFDPSAEVERESRDRELYFSRDKGHPNAQGCDLIAHLVLGFLEKRGLLPR